MKSSFLLYFLILCSTAAMASSVNFEITLYPLDGTSIEAKMEKIYQEQTVADEAILPDERRRRSPHQILQNEYFYNQKLADLVSTLTPIWSDSVTLHPGKGIIKTKGEASYEIITSASNELYNREFDFLTMSGSYKFKYKDSISWSNPTTWMSGPNIITLKSRFSTYAILVKIDMKY